MFFDSAFKDTAIIKNIEDNGGEIESLLNFMRRVKDKEKRKKIFKDVMLFKYGLEGEKSVMFELKNSFMPMHIFHNIQITDGEPTAQIDFIIITLHFIMVLETKQLMGDIEVTSEGEFIRYFRTKSGKYYKKEAIYSPINQAERHSNLIRSILKKKGIINNFPVIPMVVLANSKSIINKGNASTDIAEKVCRVDQLIKRIQELIKKIIQLVLIVYFEKHQITFMKTKHKQKNTII